MRFDEATAVNSTEPPMRSEIHTGWDIAGNANGGYLLAIAGRAMATVADRAHPVSLTAHYLSPGRAGPVTVEASVVKAGRRLSTVTATMHSADKPLMQLLGSFGDLDQLEGPKRVDATPPALPAPEECPQVVHDPERGFPPPMMEKVELRLHPDDAQFLSGKPSGRPLIRGWLRLPDEEPMDAFGLLMATDALPPTIFNANLPVAWTPTVELTAHIRGLPEPGWLRCQFSTRFISGGMLEEDGEVWDSTGRLIAQSRQLALIPRG